MAYAASGLHCTAGVADGPSTWTYTSADDDATVNGASYFSDGVSQGMKVGDFVFSYDTTNDVGSVLNVASVSGDAATTEFAVVS